MFSLPVSILFRKMREQKDGGGEVGLRGRSVNIITLPALDHEPSYEDILYYGKPFCST